MYSIFKIDCKKFIVNRIQAHIAIMYTHTSHIIMHVHVQHIKRKRIKFAKTVLKAHNPFLKRLNRIESA